MTTLYSLPFDILLVVFRELDVVGSVRLGMVSYFSIAPRSQRSRHIPSRPCLRNGIDLQRPVPNRARPPSLGGSTRKIVPGRPNSQACHASAHFPLHTRAQNLRHFQDKVPPLCFNNGINDFVFTAERPIRVPIVQNLLLLPGGKSVLAMGCAGTVTLCRIGLEGDQASLSAIAKIGFGRKRPSGALGPSKLITTTSPCPIFVYDHDNG